jgi:TolA-binding protein
MYDQSLVSSSGGTPTLDQERKLKEMEKKITKLRNENQEQKITIEKATKLLEREIGEIVDIHELSKDDSAWKGRAQKVEILKAQVKKYKAQLGFNPEGSVMTDGLSVISEGSVFTGKITHAEKKIKHLGEKKKDDLDKLKF